MQPNNAQDLQYLEEKVSSIQSAVQSIITSNEVASLIFYLKIFGGILTFLFLIMILLILTWMHLFDPIIFFFRRIYKRILFRKNIFIKKIKEFNKLLLESNPEKNFEGLVILKKVIYKLLDLYDIDGRNFVEKIENIPVTRLTNRAELLEAAKVFDTLLKNPQEFYHFSNLPTTQITGLYRVELDLILKAFNQLFADFVIIDERVVLTSKKI